MKLLMALSAFPYPCDNGAKLRAYHQLRYLSKKNKVFLVCLTKYPVTKEQIQYIKRYCKELHIVELPKWRRLLNLVNSVANTLPFQVNYCYSPQMKQLIRDLVKKHTIDACFVQQARLGRNIPFGLPNCRYFLDYMDSYAAYSLKRANQAVWYEKPFLQSEANRLAAYEMRLANKFDGYSVISNADRGKFSAGLAAKLQVIPNGVDERYLSGKLPQKSKGKKYDLIYTGNMSYLPNVEASVFLVNKVLPLLAHLTALKVCLAGANPAPEVQLLENHRAVSVTGFVADLREYLTAARIFVAPVFSEEGMQNKVLEAMALGIPVLASPDACQWLGATHGHDLLVCENEQEFARQIDHLLNNEAEAHALGNRGRTFVQNNYNWDAANRKLELSLHELVKKT